MTSCGGEILGKETLDLLKIPAVRDAFRDMVTSDKYPPDPVTVVLPDRTVTFRMVES